MEFNYSMVVLLIIISIYCYCNTIEYYTNDNTINTNTGNTDNNITKYKLLVHDWGAQIILDNIHTYLNKGDVYNGVFKWTPHYNSYTGIYHLDTGSHLLTDMIYELSRSDINRQLNKDNINYNDLQTIRSYSYVQGGTTPYMIYNDVIIDNIKHSQFPVGLMSIYKQPNMIKERTGVNGIFGMSYVNDNDPLQKYSSINKLLEDKKNKTVLIDFQNKELITGLSEPNKKFSFKGKLNYPGSIMKMDVNVIDEYNKEYKILIDTGTLYSQFDRTGLIKLNGTKDSEGTITLNNAKILPEELVGHIKPIILGYDDLYKGYIFINYTDNTIYINQ